MQPVKIGSFEITRVEEMIWTISPRFLFPDLTYQDFEPHRDWLVPHFSAEDLKLRLSIHTFVGVVMCWGMVGAVPETTPQTSR
jgi:hypothetical protein